MQTNKKHKQHRQQIQGKYLSDLPRLDQKNLRAKISGGHLKEKAYVIDFSEFAHVFLEKTGILKAIALEGDPLLNKAVKNLQLKNVENAGYDYGNHSIRGAVSMEEATFVFLEDGDDGYRSYLGEVLVLPGQKCVSQLHAGIEVFIISKQTQHQEIFEMCSKETEKTLLTFGTDRQDDWYPCARFYLEIEGIDEAVRLSVKSALHEQINQLPVAQRAGPRL